MMRHSACTAVVVTMAWISGAGAQEHAGHQHGASPALRNAPILVTINPEARVSAKWSGPTPPAAVCGSTVEIPVAVENQGFVTSTLQAHIVGLAPAGVTLRQPPQPLNGHPSEMRAIGITLSEPGPFDVTLEFSIPNEHPDLGGRARVHVLLACRL